MMKTQGAIDFMKDHHCEQSPLVGQAPQPQSQPQEKPADPVSHPTHYTQHPSGIECITITQHMSFNLGNALKYIWRADLKGNAEEDLRKAVWYLNQELKKRGHSIS